MFPIDEIPAIQSAPEDFRLLRRIPWTKPDVAFPIINVPVEVDNLQAVVWLDCETTGFQAGHDKIIELGLTKGYVDPITGELISLVASVSFYEDPGFPLPEIITQITGITDEMVSGRTIDGVQVREWFTDDPIVVAHNASFDRPFFESRFPMLDQLRWACSIKDVPWQEYGFESTKLEYLLFRLGYFYEGHRASIDAIATAYLMSQVPRASRALLAAEAANSVRVDAIGSPFHVKDTLKFHGFQWDGDNRVWHTEVRETALDSILAFLTQTYDFGGDRAHVTRLTSRDRYKG